MKAAIICIIGSLGIAVHAGGEPRIEGRVRLSSGAPAAGAQVRLFDLADLRAAPVGATTDPSGHFTLSLGALPGTALPERFELGSNYPNPFNPSTLIPYRLPSSMHVRLEVFNLLGQRIATLVDEEQPAGSHTAEWDATGAAGQAAGAGVYLYRLSGDAGKITRRMVLVDGQAGSASAGSAAAARDEAGPAWETALAYGLTVSGPGLVPYVDPAFRVTAGMSPLDVVVETPSGAPRAKVASGGILGDVDNTGRVDFLDALLVAVYSRDSSIVMPNSGDISLGDVNGDGRVDLSDVWVIATYLNDPTDPALPAGIGESVSPAASLSPDPATVTLAENGAWHRFSVEAGEPVSVVVNPAGTTPRLEITTRGGRGNQCPAEADDDAAREDGQTIYLAGCEAGQATVELRREADGTVLRSYTFEVTGTAPDLVVGEPKSSGTRESFHLSATVDNQGTAPSPSTTLRFYQSTDTTFTTADTEIGAAPVGRLGAPGGAVANIWPTAPSTAGTYYYGACVDAVSGESDTTNNCSTALTVKFGPDLVVNWPTVSNSSPTAGESLTLRTSVRNRGNMSSASTTLRYIRSADSTITASDTEVGTDQVSNRSAGGAVPVQSVVLTAPSDPGTYYYGACVDSVTGEIDTQNNCSGAATVTVGGAPDLVVDTPTLSESAPAAGTSFTVSVTVRNQGSSSAGSTTLRYYGSIDTNLFPELPATTFNEVPFHTDGVGGLAPSGSSTHFISLRAPDMETTKYYMACVVSVTGENDLANNCSAAVAVDVQGTPDLLVDTPATDTSPPAAGSSFTLSTTVRNQGNGSSPATMLRYYQSADSTISSSDAAVGGNSVSGLAAAGSSAQSVSLTAPDRPGRYYYGACVDVVTGETDTTNNCSAAVTITVVSAPGPDLVADTPTTTVSHPTVGTSFRMVVSVRNQGDSASEPATLRFYRSADSTITTSDERIDSADISALSPDETAYLHSDPRAPSTPGTYYYGVCVVSVTGESNTGNNCSPALAIVAVDQPDLIVETPWISHETPDPTRYLDLHAVVRNQGAGPVQGFLATSFDVFVSTDSTIGLGDTKVTGFQWRHRNLPSGSEEGITISFHAPSTAGEYHYYACVEQVEGESDTTNNCSEAVKATVKPTDLMILLPAVSSNSMTAGASFTLRATVLNRGGLRSDSTTRIRYFRSTDATITSMDTPVGTDWVSYLNAHETSEKSISLTAPSTAGTYYYGACVDTVSGEADTTNNCSEAVEVDVGERPLALQLTSCFVFQNQHFVRFKVRASVPVSSVVVHTYQVEGRSNKLHLMETTSVGDLSAGDSYEKLTSRYFPAHLRPYLTTCTASVEWANGAETPGFSPTTIAVPDLPPPPPTYTPPAHGAPRRPSTPTERQVWTLWLSFQDSSNPVYRHYITCGVSLAGAPPCPFQDHNAYWSSLPSHLQRCAFEDCAFIHHD